MAPDELNIHNNQPKTRAHDPKEVNARRFGRWGAIGECDLIVWGRSSWAGDVKN